MMQTKNSCGGKLSITVSFDTKRGVFICRCSFSERGIPDQAKFFYNPMTKAWETKKVSSAVRLREYFDDSATKRISNNSVEITNERWNLVWHNLVPKDKRLKDYQKHGVKFALGRNHSYICFEQGLGKTPTAIAVMNAMRAKTLIICPPFLVDNWKREIKEWGPQIVDSIESGKSGFNVMAGATIIPDSLIDRDAIQEFIQGQDFELLIVDEAHRFKTADAKRTKALFGFIAPKIPKVVLLSGTPMPNRPIELYPALSSLAHNTIGFYSEHEYAIKYCDARERPIRVRGELKTVWDYSGASYLEKLKAITQDFMLRRTKAEMLPELKPKEEQAVLLSGVKHQEIKKLEVSIFRKFGDDLSKIVKNQNLGAISEYRKEVGIRKVKPAVEYIRGIAEQGETILVLGWHVEVLKQIYEKLKGPSFAPQLITGATNKKFRSTMIENIQNGSSQILVAQITTMVGYTLTKAKRVIVVEPSWSPADNDQATDRPHRIGQTDLVIVDYLVLPNSIDERIVKSFLTKKKNIQKAIG